MTEVRIPPIRRVRPRQTAITLASAGAVMGLTGALKALDHWSDPFVQAWCRPAMGSDGMPLLFAMVGGEPLFLGHCWGCYAAALGAAMVAVAVWRGVGHPARAAR